jgi:excinuclease ABC subunit C
MPESIFDAKKFLATLTSKPGVYRMLDADGEVLYVGKARNLKNRVSSYFRDSGLSPKTRALVARIQHIEITATHTETEALILENNLIKALQPRYNVLLRDDKSYPYLYLSAHRFPRLSLHRGAKRGKGRYFGPYPSASSARESLSLLKKIFPVRQCEDSFYQNRSRPCLQYQIKYCTAPCVNLITPEAYQEDVQHAILFLEGKSQAAVTALVEKMQAAAVALEYERAARYRDQINHLRTLQERQYVDTEGGMDVDVVAAVQQDGVGCVQVITVRDGRHLGSRAYFPRQTQDADAAAIVAAFVPQFYLARADLPAEIILNHALEDVDVLAEALAQQAGRKIHLHSNVRGPRARWVEMAEENARVSLAQHKPLQHRDRLAALALALGLEEMPQRIECFDVSHTQGERTVTSCVVFDAEGPRNSDYRRFNIEGIQPGDDYAALHQALTRRYTRLLKEDAALPDLLVIDGGQNQVAQARDVLQELQVPGVFLLGVAKGTTRKPGLETLILPGGKEIALPKDSPALHLIQQIRDEAHRFAITGHRQRRAKARTISVLEEIEGIGDKRRQALLSHFGGLQGIKRAGVEDLARVPGISPALARKIYDVFHAE